MSGGSITRDTSNLGPREPNNDMVICPNCTCQFGAVPVNRQSDVPEKEVRQFLGWLTVDFIELRNVEMPLLADSWTRFREAYAHSAGGNGR